LKKKSKMKAEEVEDNARGLLLENDEEERELY
jgi:hypothetical protein